MFFAVGARGFGRQSPAPNIRRIASSRSGGWVEETTSVQTAPADFSFA
jgi:hypothetical protein